MDLVITLLTSDTPYHWATRACTDRQDRREIPGSRNYTGFCVRGSITMYIMMWEFE